MKINEYINFPKFSTRRRTRRVGSSTLSSIPRLASRIHIPRFSRGSFRKSAATGNITYDLEQMSISSAQLTKNNFIFWPPIQIRSKQIAYPAIQRKCSRTSLARVSSVQNRQSTSGSIFVDSDFPHSTIFVDADFPHTDGSIGIPTYCNVRWLRPDEIVPGSKEDQCLPWTIYNDPKYSDIRQGNVGDCWLISALAVIAEISDLLKHIFITKTISPIGKYILQLFINGRWTTIVVDDHFPCKANNKLLFCEAKGKQLWASLIEKAYAKVVKSYGNIKGSCKKAFLILTGAPCNQIEISQTNDILRAPLIPEENVGLLCVCCSMHSTFFEQVFAKLLDSCCTIKEICGKIFIHPRAWCNAMNVVTPEDGIGSIWNQLKSAKTNGYLMSASCGRENVEMAEYQNANLTQNHAYSLLDVKECQLRRFVQLRNPWGREGCTSNATMISDERIRQFLNFETENDTGTFWMPFEIFTKYFNHFYICEIKCGYKYFNDKITDGLFAVYISLAKSSKVDFILHQYCYNSRTQKEIDLCILVFESDLSGNVRNYLKSNEQKFSDHVNLSISLKKGKYICLCLSLTQYILKSEHTEMELSFGINSSEQFDVVPIHESNSTFPLHVFVNCISQFLISKGKVDQHTEHNACEYKCSRQHGICGLWFLFENNDDNKTLEFSLDCIPDSENPIENGSQICSVDVLAPGHKVLINLLPYKSKLLKKWKHRTSLSEARLEPLQIIWERLGNVGIKFRFSTASSLKKVNLK